MSVSDQWLDCRYRPDKKLQLVIFSLIEIEAVNGSGPVDLWFNDRLRKESRMGGNDEDMFDGELPVIWSGVCP